MHDPRRIPPHIGRPAHALAKHTASHVAEPRPALRAAAIDAYQERFLHRRVISAGGEEFEFV
jgi:hypothetical protein